MLPFPAGCVGLGCRDSFRKTRSAVWILEVNVFADGHLGLAVLAAIDYFQQHDLVPSGILYVYMRARQGQSAGFYQNVVNSESLGPMNEKIFRNR